MSSNFKEFPAGQPPWRGNSAFSGLQTGSSSPSGKEWALSLLLFILTFICVSCAGLFYFSPNLDFFEAFQVILKRPSFALLGLRFSIPLMIILLAHELGHFFACRIYGIECTPPFFLPVPISITGTLGAFIKIKTPFRNKRALFDVGIAGPLAGFLVSLPVLWIGLSLSRLVPKGVIHSVFYRFGEPLIYQFIGIFSMNCNPVWHEIKPHPIAMAGWFGLLVTSLNLLPAWQLDGGHIAYAVFGRRHQKRITIAVLILLMLVGLSGWPTPTYMVFGIMILILGYRSRYHHPSTLNDREPLGYGRKALALLALIILLLSFTPVPVSIVY